MRFIERELAAESSSGNKKSSGEPGLGLRDLIREPIDSMRSQFCMP